MGRWAALGAGGLHRLGARLRPFTPHAVAARHVAGVRRLLGSFIRAVHPDLTPSFPEEARRVNQRSLAQLNAFVDRLEAEAAPRLEDGPETARELPFFRGHETRAGRLLPGRVLPLKLPVPSLPVGADEDEREYLAARLVRDAEVLLESTAGGFSDQPEVPPLFTQKGAGRTAFDKLWWQQTHEEMVREALHGPDDAEVRLHTAMGVFARKCEHQLLRRYTRIRNGKRRRRKLEAVSAKVDEKVKAKFGGLPPTAELLREEEERAERGDAARVLQSGYHPDLVFMGPGISEEQRREAIRRICGMNLASDADFWLLENLWKAMRGEHPPVPLVITVKDYKAHHEAGFIQAPWDFSVAALCDLLEEHLDTTRRGLALRAARRAAAPAPAPPAPGEEEPPLLALAAAGGGWESEGDSDSDHDGNGTGALP